MHHQCLGRAQSQRQEVAEDVVGGPASEGGRAFFSWNPQGPFRLGTKALGGMHLALRQGQRD